MNTYTTYNGDTKGATYDELIMVIERYAVPKYDIQVTDHLPTETVQVRRHKRKSSRRWQKKYLKKFGTKQVAPQKIYQIGNKILISPEMYRKAMDQIQQTQRDYFDRQSAMMWGYKL
jgi:hypothetical protein